MSENSATRKVTVLNPAGLHARPSLAVVQTVRRSQSKVQVRTPRQTVDASDILQILGLARRRARNSSSPPPAPTPRKSSTSWPTCSPIASACAASRVSDNGLRSWAHLGPKSKDQRPEEAMAMGQFEGGADAGLEGMAARPLDVLVIGGGIVGAGIARDAAMRGLRVGLVEQYDFAAGTSSRSSRLLHGGLRYLAQGRIGLVREASLEKLVLHRIAPHLAEPLPFLFPSYRGTPWPLWQLRIGVKFYDLLCGGRNVGRSQWLSKAEVAAQVPGLAQAGLKGAVRYFDGLTNDARLVIDTLRSASKHGAMLQNYCRLEAGGQGQTRMAVSGARRARQPGVGIAVRHDRQRRRPVGRPPSPQPRPTATDQGRTPGGRSRASADPQRRGPSRGQSHPVCHPLGPAGHSGHHRHGLSRTHRGRCLRAGRRGLRVGGGEPRFS